ncbi:LamG-like jellyroll fold domain-containing protein [Rugosimonospora acidiphila]|uniref:LamG-like jellyroll fold domain-containing protein n=1 Tax=Rugosimonospora acidiphila TaxID=556531 RepID=UPI0031E70062
MEPIKPSEFVLKPAGGHQQPTGDILEVAPEAEKAGAKVVDRLSDYYAGWPYQFSWDNWFDVVDQQIAEVQASGITNLKAYALWNESDNTWLPQNGTFEDFWTKTYREVRRLDPTTPIQGPSFSDNISDMQNFLQNAVATNTVPDILAWHELERSSKISGDIAMVEAMEKQLGISPRPIDIEEYASPQEVGIPGDLVGYIAKFERLGVQNAELAFWNQSGALGDLLTGQGGDPNGAYWLYKWYADMSGNMVTTTPPSADGSFDAAASVTSDKRELDVVTGGAAGPTAITIDGLDKLAVGQRVDVKLEYTPSYGRTTAVSGPTTISDTDYQVGSDGSISVPIVMNPAYGYHLVVTPATSSAKSLAGVYTVTNVNSGLALDTASAGDDWGTLVDQAKVTDGTTQTWKLVDAGSGLYKIQNAASGLVLGVQNISTSNGAPVLEWGDTGTADHLWQLMPDGRGDYRFANYGTGLVLAVTGMSTADGAQVVQWTDGTATNGCTPSGPRQPGKLGKALNLCGTTSYVSLPTGVVSGVTGDYTVSAWVNPAANAQWSRLFDLGTGTNAYMFLTVNDGSNVRYAITTSGAGGEQQIIGNGTLPLNQWSLVTVTLAGTTGTLYVNGKAVGSNSNMTVHPSALGATKQNYIGKSQYGGDPALNAAVDDLNIYDRALSASEVAALAGGRVGAGDVVHYTFDEDSGTNVVDSSGNGRSGTVIVGAASTTSTSASDEATADHFWTLHAVNAPGAPRAAAAALDTDGKSVDVTWSAPNSNGGSAITGYKVYREGTSEPVASVGADTSSAQVTGLWPGDTAQFTVTAVNPAGQSAPSGATGKVTIPDGATAAPGKGTLSNDNGWDTGLQDGSYNVTMNLWWGETGSIFKLYENGTLIATKQLSLSGVGQQSVTVPVTGKDNGSYTYTGELINSKGATATGSDIVTVTQANPGKPVLSSDNYDNDGSYTVTANLWWGTNATSYKFYENNVLVGQGELTANTPDAQTATLRVAGKAVGSYTYRVDFTNPAGTVSSDPLTVNVTK